MRLNLINFFCNFIKFFNFWFCHKLYFQSHVYWVIPVWELCEQYASPEHQPDWDVCCMRPIHRSRSSDPHRAIATKNYQKIENRRAIFLPVKRSKKRCVFTEKMDVFYKKKMIFLPKKKRCFLLFKTMFFFTKKTMYFI